MLGLANILSTSSSADQETHSLLLDGTGDYLDTGNAFQSPYRHSFSWSFWIKPDDGQPGGPEYLLGSNNADDTDAFFITLRATGKIRIDHEANNDAASYVTLGSGVHFTDGAGGWKHVCVTVTKATNTSYIIYIDGAAVAGSLTGAVAEDEHAAWTSADNTYIGSTNENGTALNPFTGKMDEVALFNVALSAAEVAGIYNNGRPFNLTSDFGDYDRSAALLAYYKMFDGAFDDKVNGIVHDAHNPGFGAELWDGIQGDDANWDVQDNNEKAEDDGAVKITYVDHSGGALIYLRDAKDLNTDLTVGATYKITFETKVNTGTVNWVVRDGASSSTDYQPSTTITNTDFESREIYFVAGHTTNAFMFPGSMGTGEIVWIKNIFLEQLNGFPGITAANATFSTDSPDQQPRAHALDLDGVGDYLNLGDTLDQGTGDFTVCFWAKVTHADMDDQNFISKKQGTQDFWRIRTLSTGVSGAGQITVVGKTGDVVAFSMTGAGVTDNLLNTWMHVGVTVDRDGDGVIYVNGATTTYGSTTDISGDTPEGVNLDNTGDFQIGALVDDGMQGQMDGVAIWDEALPADAIAAIYAAGRSHDLTTVVPGSGHYDADWTDDLQGYWRMGDGAFDDPAAGVIHDQLAIGPEILSNGDFASGQIGDGGYDWTATGLDTENTIVVTSNKLVMVTDGNNGNDSQALRVNSKGPDFEIGKTYRVEFDASDITGAGFKVVDFGGDTSKLITNVTSDGHYNATHVAENIEFAIFRMTNGSASAGKFDNISIKEIPGAGFGAEIVTNGTFDSDLTGWTTAGLDTENTIAVSDGKVVMATDGNNGTGGALLLQQADVFVLGKTYKIEFDAHDIAGAGFKIQSGGNENISGITADGHYVKYHVANSTLLRIYRRTGSSASSGKFDNISVKLLNGSPGVTTADATFVKLPV